MIKKHFFLVICILLLMFFGIVMFKSQKESVLQVAERVITKAPSSHPSIFYDEMTFFDGVTKTGKSNPTQTHHIRGGIIPHHLLPGFMLTDFFYRLSQQHPRTIILLGPNHYEKGKYPLLTSLYSWETPYGKVEPEIEIIQDLIKKGLVHVDEDVLPNDHAVSGMMPFIRYYSPDVRVVPLLISGFTTEREVTDISRVIAAYLKDLDIVFIAPVDFSHYLTSEKAKEKDMITLKILKNFDYSQLFQLNNDYLDSPPSIAALLMVMKEINATSDQLLHHTNSGELQHNPYIPTTSYFSIIYY